MKARPKTPPFSVREFLVQTRACGSSKRRLGGLSAAAAWKRAKSEEKQFVLRRVKKYIPSMKRSGRPLWPTTCPRGCTICYGFAAPPWRTLLAAAKKYVQAAQARKKTRA